MFKLLEYIRSSLSTLIGLYIVGFATLVFVISLGYMSIRSREFLRNEVMENSQQVLLNTSMRVENVLNEVEIAATAAAWLQSRHLVADSAWVYSRRIVDSNTHFHRSTVAYEPYYFADKGQYFAVYTYRSEDQIFSEQESGDYRYHELPWYTNPKIKNEACWVDPYFDTYWNDSFIPEMVTSYSIPLLDKERNFVGVLATDVSLNWLNKTIQDGMAIKGAYCVMVGKDGEFFVHPDSSKLSVETLFTGLDPDKDADMIALANSMVNGEEGSAEVNFNGRNSYVFYRPLSQTGWSIAIVCPEDDLLWGYNHLSYMVTGIIALELLVLLFLCRWIIRRTLKPVTRLALQTRRIAAGHFDEIIPPTDNPDAIGLLQNTFSKMQASINSYVGKMSAVNSEIEKRNRELVEANLQAQESLEKKIAFMQDITHQVRTPLNIVIGFAQVLGMGHRHVPEDELRTITEAMHDKAAGIKALVEKLFIAMIFEGITTLEKSVVVNCNDLCREIVGQMKADHPHMIPLHYVTTLPDDLTIHADVHELPKRVIRQMLDNAYQFTRRGCIVLNCRQETHETVSFIVTDTGVGIDPDESHRIFDQFYKTDYYGEGLGNGLYLCRRSAQLLGGSFKLDTTYRGGARFVFTLPLK